MASTKITREQVRSTIEAWQRSEMTAAQVHAWAEDRYAASAFEPEDDVVNEVLARLDMLDLNLTIVDDAPALLRPLTYKASEVEKAVAEMERYFETIDLRNRMKTCANDPLYAPFCRGVELKA